MSSYSYRRRLTSRELIPALGAGAGVGVGVGLLVAYLTQIVLRREPLSPRPPADGPGRPSPGERR